MADLVVIVPSRGRPHTVAGLVHAFDTTCTAHSELLIAIDHDDPQREAYDQALSDIQPVNTVCLMVLESGSMVEALNAAAGAVLDSGPAAIGFMGDDHRPRTRGWDSRYLEALRGRPGLVYGNDLIQGVKLPTQVAMSASVVRALGHTAPPTLTHLYVDNYWRDLGQAAGCLTYLPDVVVEHLHPVAGKAEWDAGYKRVNDPDMYHRDRAAYAKYWIENRDRDVLAVRQAVAA